LFATHRGVVFALAGAILSTCTIFNRHRSSAALNTGKLPHYSWRIQPFEFFDQRTVYCVVSRIPSRILARRPQQCSRRRSLEAARAAVTQGGNVYPNTI